MIASRSCLLVLAMTAVHATAGAQTARGARFTDQWLAGVGAFAATPIGQFRRHEDGGAGAELMLGFQPWRRRALVIRAHAGGFLYDRLRARGYQHTCWANGCWNQRVSYNARTHMMWFAQAGPEVMRTDGTWRPFAYAIAGSSWFSSRARELAYSVDYEPGIFWSRNFSSSYGAGVRRVTTRTGRERGFELSLRFTHNGNAEYVTEDAIVRIDDYTFWVVPIRGDASVLLLRLGFWVGPHVRPGERCPYLNARCDAGPR